MDKYGDIMVFVGKKIPDGWHPCDGTNGTPDLRGDKFQYVMFIGH